jgi:CDP-glucose 4,6-dehydratase
MEKRGGTMENLGLDQNFWDGRKVLLTGHTGFKGGWATLLLTMMGARVFGLSLPPTDASRFFNAVGIDRLVKSNEYANIKNYDDCLRIMKASAPEVIIHMAAQPLVRESYLNPLETYFVNVIGTANILEAARQVDSVKAIVNVTTDKCYKNNEWEWSYRESEALGGYDPYSSSKACSEIVSAAYRDSFFNEKGVQLATARAGNVIGGGDWSKDRLLPDILRSIDVNEKIIIRSPLSVRPWQHVLEPITGYLLLAQRLAGEKNKFNSAWNFGPEENDCWPVSRVVSKICEITEHAVWTAPGAQQPHEASFLKLDSSKAKTKLGWQPRWHVDTALEKTVEWHQDFKLEKDMYESTINQILSYQRDII